MQQRQDEALKKAEEDYRKIKAERECAQKRAGRGFKKDREIIRRPADQDFEKEGEGESLHKLSPFFVSSSVTVIPAGSGEKER